MLVIKMKEKLIRWMQGRYGGDELGRFLIVVYIVVAMINLFLESELISLFLLGLMIWNISRILSKKIYARRKENQIFLAKMQPFQRGIKIIKLNLKDRNNRYYICPKCHQICRIPRTNKKGMITCPRCFHQFKARS